MATTGWTLNGLDLRRVGYNIRTTGGWDGLPPSKIAEFAHGFRHGVVRGDRGFYDKKTMSITMDIFPTNPDGTVTLQPEAHIQANIDELLGAVYARNRIVTLQKTFGVGPTTREIEVAALTSVPLGSGFGVQGRRMTLVFEAPYPLWHELPEVNLSGLSGAQVLTNNGNAPVGDAILTCTAAGRLTVDASGDWIEVDTTAGGSVIIDTHTGSITQSGSPADERVALGQDWIPDFEPGTNNLTITGTWNIDYYHTYF